MKKGEKWKIIFLDVDGVICLGKDHFRGFNSEAMDRLKWVIEQTGAKVVISSSWRTGNLEKTKLEFPEWLREHIIDETKSNYHYVKSSFNSVRGNEIQTWIHDHLDYPWYAWPELDAEYRTYKEDGSFKKMDSNRVGRDFTYVILDDDIDMLYVQKDWFINTEMMEGLTQELAEKCVKILNKI